MPGDCVEKEVCDLKHKDVEQLREEFRQFKDCIYKKLSSINYLAFTVLGALIANLIIMLIKK